MQLPKPVPKLSLKLETMPKNGLKLAVLRLRLRVGLLRYGLLRLSIQWSPRFLLVKRPLPLTTTSQMGLPHGELYLPSFDTVLMYPSFL